MKTDIFCQEEKEFTKSTTQEKVKLMIYGEEEDCSDGTVTKKS